MHNFIAASIGGILIGAAALLLMASHGKIMGISGIVSRLLPPLANDWQWRAAFIAGIVAAPLAWRTVSGSMPAIEISASIPMLALAGAIVGLGTALGNGCTSGHGVCGVARLSKRSVVATGLFMASAIVTVAVSKHLLGN
ncbi:YeeE/YedE family protein [Marinobacterium sedimentorum]|uniref:YeeE/YedE family protein n=1 Tax=Marinobacterium sedimentorum TaxID=2927804 RepID=UPI0020C67B43|nr:YeeE/YedE family protein [Marinobacterium sedimentorum]MCP8688109.1 YeeE/YedE family protein [Marinobacterium sedimentorum]